MKTRKVIKLLFVVLFAMVASYGIFTSLTTNSLSNLAMANVEALANGEGGGTGTIYCCGNAAVCLRLIDSNGNKRDVAGIQSTIPCP